MRISDWSSDVCSSDLAIAKLTFEVPDFARFPALNLARQALQTGGAAPTILNAANEVAVDAFLKGRIGFLDITRIVRTEGRRGGKECVSMVRLRGWLDFSTNNQYKREYHAPKLN